MQWLDALRAHALAQPNLVKFAIGSANAEPATKHNTMVVMLFIVCGLILACLSGTGFDTSRKSLLSPKARDVSV